MACPDGGISGAGSLAGGAKAGPDCACGSDELLLQGICGGRSWERSKSSRFPYTGGGDVAGLLLSIYGYG